MASFINDGPTAWFCVEWAPTNRHKNHDIIYFDNRQEADTFIIAKSRNNKSIYMYEKGMYISRSGKEQKALVCIFWTSAAAIAKWGKPPQGNYGYPIGPRGALSSIYEYESLAPIYENHEMTIGGEAINALRIIDRSKETWTASLDLAPFMNIEAWADTEDELRAKLVRIYRTWNLGSQLVERA